MCDNDRRSERFCSNAVLRVSFTWQVVKTRVIRVQRAEGRDARDQIAFCAFHLFLVEVQTNTGYIQLYKIHNVTTWRLGLWALIVTCNKNLLISCRTSRRSWSASSLGMDSFNILEKKHREKTLNHHLQGCGNTLIFLQWHIACFAWALRAVIV